MFIGKSNVNRRILHQVCTIAYDYSSYFCKTNLLARISQKEMLYEKDNYVLKKLDPNYLFVCDMKRKLSEGELVALFADSGRIIAFTIFSYEDGILSMSDIMVRNFEGFEEKSNSVLRNIYNLFLNYACDEALCMSPSIIDADFTYLTDTLESTLFLADFEYDETIYRKIIIDRLENLSEKERKGIIFIDGYGRNRINKQR